MHFNRFRAAAAATALVIGLTAGCLPAAVYAADAPAQEESQSASGDESEKKDESKKEDKKDEKKEEKKEETKEEEKKEEEKPAGEADGESQEKAGENKEGTPKPRPQAEGQAQTSIADALHGEQATMADYVVYQVRIGYEFDDGSFDEWARGTALLAGQKHLITRQSLADTSAESALSSRIQEERGESYQRVGVYLNNSSDTEKHIKVRVSDTEGSQLDVADIKIKNGLAMITLRLVPDGNPCVFAEKTSPKEIEDSLVSIKASGNLDDKAEVKTFAGVVVPAPEGKEGLYVSADMTGVSAVGGILYNGDGHVVGMIAGEGDEKPCYTVNAIETLLSTNGIKFRTAGQIQEKTNAIEQQDIEDSIQESEDATPQTDKTGLQESISAAQALNEKDYTGDSFSAMKAALDTAVRSNENGQATQAEVNVAKKNLDDAMNGLEMKKKGFDASKAIRIIGIAAIAAIVAISAVLLIKGKKASSIEEHRMPEKKKGKKRVSAPAATAKKKKPRREKPEPEDPPYTADDEDGSGDEEADDDEEDFFDDDELDLTKPHSQKGGRVTSANRDPGLTYADDEEESRVEELDRNGKNDTTLLKKGAYLIRKDNGKKIPITSNEFLIGKEVGKVDYAIGNETVSRTHALITLERGKYYIEDQGSLNYTYVNGKKIPAYTKTTIMDGSTIRLSDVEMVFREGAE